jgi:hypothetical protein
MLKLEETYVCYRADCAGLFQYQSWRNTVRASRSTAGLIAPFLATANPSSALAIMLASG